MRTVLVVLPSGEDRRANQVAKRPEQVHIGAFTISVAELAFRNLHLMPLLNLELRNADSRQLANDVLTVPRPGAYVRALQGGSEALTGGEGVGGKPARTLILS